MSFHRSRLCAEIQNYKTYIHSSIHPSMEELKNHTVSISIQESLFLAPCRILIKERYGGSAATQLLKGVMKLLGDLLEGRKSKAV